MDNTHQTRISKFLSLHLRHRPELLGLTLEPGGWVGVKALLAACAHHKFPLTKAQLEAIVSNSDKQRFAFDETGTRIRAQQGHSVPVELGLVPQVPPSELYHGTVASALPAIRQHGLQKMTRHHVHLSPDVETARRVGSRRGRPVLLVIDAAALYAAGTLFYQAGNGVWLTDHVPPQYLRELPF
ncbi:RNA 2'-phosphotransferase [Hymenobacter taeanensis]|uniref:Probable RNA 2'-phosphotransferase n=1 Tax=Hymenobacter taeanensis TaxID=2735321 RepID=A0A6M6BKL2_9BACT|nr:MULTISPECIES: RNA 2'-phosphotransferase [Hymenobacter]QJX48646.1 RNA 2'-phosphotransferase [Hymenobacter taeanensis]UOQ81855.1 RNA 2'-phosphotransferase [Hymenobacter sp. 5414T-23]